MNFNIVYIYVKLEETFVRLLFFLIDLKMRLLKRMRTKYIFKQLTGSNLHLTSIFGG